MQEINPASYSVPLPLVWAILVAIVTIGGGTLFALVKIAIQFGAWLARFEAIESTVEEHGEKIGAVQAIQHEHSDKIHALRLDMSTRLAGVEARESLHHAGGE